MMPPRTTNAVVTSNKTAVLLRCCCVFPSYFSRTVETPRRGGGGGGQENTGLSLGAAAAMVKRTRVFGFGGSCVALFSCGRRAEIGRTPAARGHVVLDTRRPRSSSIFFSFPAVFCPFFLFLTRTRRERIKFISREYILYFDLFIFHRAFTIRKQYVRLFHCRLYWQSTASYVEVCPLRFTLALNSVTYPRPYS